MHFHTGGLYPEKRFLHGMSKNISVLDYLVNFYQPEFSKESWTIPKFKVQTRDPNFWKTHPYGPQLVKKDQWEQLDYIVDMYTEGTRVSNPGYGQKYSSMELWNGVSNNNALAQIKAPNPEKFRDDIYNVAKIQDARPAYVTVSKGLYTRLKQLHSKEAKNVLDISAFGDRMVAAAGCQLHYTGIDPDVSLSVGISKLRQDLEKVTDYMTKVYTLPMEGFWPREKYDIITLSPPPFNAEPYVSGDHQTHKTYPDFKSWFNGFLRETIYRCSQWINPGGILAFSVLDRIPKEKDKVTLIYTEALIFLAEHYGFEFVEIFGLGSGTGWWVFKFTGKCNDRFMKFYPELSEYVHNEHEDSNDILMELVRKCCLKYVSTQLKSYSSSKHMDRDLERFLMSKMDANGDPVFIDHTSSYAFEEFSNFDITTREFILQNADGSYYSSVMFKDITSVFDSLSRYIRWLSNTTAYQNASKLVKVMTDKDSHLNLCVEKRNSYSVIGMLRKLVPFGETFKIIDFGGAVLSIWRSPLVYSGAKLVEDQRSVATSQLRYDILDAIYAHHYTRPKDRIAIMEQSENEKVVDLFATPFNANSELFLSPYPDVDKDSLGNFFTVDLMTLGTTTFMANPPDYPGFIDRVIEKIDKTLRSNEVTFFISTVLWEQDQGKYIKMIKDPTCKDEVDFAEINNPIISYIFKKFNPNHIKMMYILDKKRFPTVDPVGSTSFERKGTESTGIIVSSKRSWKYDKILDKLGPNILFE